MRVGLHLVLHPLSLTVHNVYLLIVSGKQKEQVREQIRNNIRRGKETIPMVLAAICTFFAVVHTFVVLSRIS